MHDNHSGHRSWLGHLHHLVGCIAIVLVGYYFFALSDSSLTDYRFYLALGACCLIHFAFHIGREKLLEKTFRD